MSAPCLHERKNSFLNENPLGFDREQLCGFIFSLIFETEGIALCAALPAV